MSVVFFLKAAYFWTKVLLVCFPVTVWQVSTLVENQLKNQFRLKILLIYPSEYVFSLISIVKSTLHSPVLRLSFFWCFFFFLIKFIYFNWRLITILYWFCHTSTWIRQGCTRVPHPGPASHLLPHTIPLGHPSAPAPSILYPALNLDWWFISYMILYIFQCHSPKSSPPTTESRLFYTSVSFLLSRIQGYRYHLSKFHIYVLVYCIGVFLSGSLHSV